jgi:hydroxymethylglutaryl-CoA reductase (NADPH)
MSTNDNTLSTLITGQQEVPVDRKNNYSKKIIRERLNFLEQFSSTELQYLDSSAISPELTAHNIEKIIGFAQTPVGVVGPLRVNGKHAKGDFYIPMATTEGTLVMSYQRGSRILMQSGGVKVSVVKDAIQRAPLFVLNDLNAATEFVSWCTIHLEKLKQVARSTTNHGVLIGFTPFILGNVVILRFDFTTGDAMGMNMVTKAVKEICRYISAHFPVKKYLLECNMAADKKSSYLNMILGRGKTVIAEAVIDNTLIKKYLNVSAEKIVESYNLQMLGNVYAGVMGNNYHIANGIAAVFLACGQDLANILESGTGIMSFRMQDENLYLSVTLPSLVVGTVGGGTSLPTQRECLSIMGCYGKSKALKFAEIIAALIVAGELSLAGSIAANDFVEAHEKYGRNGHKI